MKTLTISAYNRPDYLARVLEALCRCDGVGEYSISVILDPCDKTEELAEIVRCRGLRHTVPGSHLGCGGAILYSMELGFADPGSDYHIHLEDDTVPSPDCLRWFEWAGRNAPPMALTVSAYNQHGGESPADACGFRHWFTPWGWATWRHRFDSDLAPAWDRSFWDGGVQRVRKRLGAGEIFPRVSRIQNIGAERGTFCPSPEFHGRNHRATRVATDKEMQTRWVVA